ncbi:MAG: uracil-DNA glycosylase [Betaproteobacteria bacterium]|nr:uracil-DNA glycosylase [Betaproteobacteria bacterium]
MTSRRDLIIEEMELGPVWRLRGTTGGAVAESGAAEASLEPPQSIPGVKNREGEPPLVAPDTAMDTGDRATQIARMAWPELKHAVASCDACALCKTRKNTVFGVGDERADWLLVGEAPGAEEDARGEPFVGQAGRLLDNMLAAIGLQRRAGVYIANVLKCRPPGNRNPEPEEVSRCSPHLIRQIELIRPKLIVAMGRFAAQTLLHSDASIASMRGRMFEYQGVPLVVTYHPAYLLRNMPDKAKAWEDLVFARRALRSLISGAAPAH